MCRSLGFWSQTFGLLAVLFGLAQPVRAANLIIPPPPGVFGQFEDASGNLRDALLIDGVPVAFRYDDFWSYSAKMLDLLQDAGFIPASYGDYQAATGTGNLDVVVMTGAAGTENSNVGVSGSLNFEDPVQSPPGGTSSADLWWGQNDQDNNGPDPANIEGPVTVGQMLTYLQEFDPNNTTPVLIFDNNQTGTAPSTLASARVQVIDPTTDSVIAEWFFDATNDNNQFDENSQALAFGQFTFHGTSGNDYTVNHNLGSGKPDFLIFAPSMDLSVFDPSFLFVVDMHLDGLNNGPEEAFLTGRVLADTTTSVVPEPASLALLGLGSLVALIPVAIRSRKSKRSE